MRKPLSLLLALCVLLCALPALAEAPLSLDAIMREIDKDAKALTVSPAAFRISQDRQSIYIDRPEVTGADRYTIAYNIYDAASNPVNYFYSLEEHVAATPGYGGLFNVFIVVTDDAGEQNVQNIGWQELSWPLADRLTVGKASFEVSPDKKSIFVDRPAIACRSGRVTIAYNIYDHNSQPVNYFYSTEKRVAATPGYDGKFNVFIVVTDTETGEQDVQNIGWTVLGQSPQTGWPATVDGVRYDLADGEVTATGCEAGVRTLRLADQVNGRWVTAIADSAFAAGSGGSAPVLEGSLTLPSRLERIGDSAFASQQRLTGALTLPDTLREIGPQAFAGTGFTSLAAIPEGVRLVPERAFARSRLSGEVRMPVECEVWIDAFAWTDATPVWEGESWPYTLRGIVYDLKDGMVTAVGGSGDLTNLQFADVLFGRRVQAIGDNSFSCSQGGYPELGGGLTFPKYLASVGYGAFSQCGITGSLAFPDTMKSIGAWAFSGCAGLNGSLTLPDGVKKIGDSAFSGCALTGGLTIPSWTSVIGREAFRSCRFTGELVIPGSVRTVERGAFADCADFTSLRVEEGVRSVERYAFQNCTGLTGTVRIPSGCQLSPGAFEGTHVTLTWENPPGDCPFLFEAEDGEITITGYRGGDSAVVIPGTIGGLPVTAIGEKAFRAGEGIESVVIREGVRRIGESAFQRCADLRSVQLPDSLEQIGHFAFSECSKLEEITIPAKTASVGMYAFEHGLELRSATFLGPDTVLEQGAFYDCCYLTIRAPAGSPAETWARQHAIPFIAI